MNGDWLGKSIVKWICDEAEGEAMSETLDELERRYGPGCCIPADPQTVQDMATTIQALVSELRAARAVVSAADRVDYNFYDGSYNRWQRLREALRYHDRVTGVRTSDIQPDERQE